MEWGIIAGIIGAVVGGVTGLTGFLIDNSEELRDIKAEKKELQKQHEYAQEKLDLKWKEAVSDMEHQTEQQLEQADMSDKMTDLTENILDMDFNNGIDNLQDQQEMYGLTNNAEMMSNGMSEGSSLAQLSSSGVRSGSSMDNAVAMQSAVNTSQLEANQAYQNNQFDYQLNSMLNSLAQNKADIYGSRWAADQTREDVDYTRSLYATGGLKQQQYQLAKDSEQSRFNYSNKQLQNEIDDRTGWKPWVRGGTILLSGGAAGFSSGYNIGSTLQEYKSSK